MKNTFQTSEIFNFKEKIEYTDEGIISKRVIEKKIGSVTLFSFDKDQRLSTHSAPFDALLQVVEGKAEIQIADKVFELSENHSIIMPAGIPHAVIATEKFKMVLTMIKE